MSLRMTRTTEGDRLSQLLPRLAGGQEERISIGDIISRLEGRAHTTLLVLFALPNVLPAIPGTSAITGMPLVYLALQMTLGQRPWLPAFIANRSFSRTGLATVMDQAKPWLERSERFLHPRLGALTRGRMERVIGVLMLLLAFAVVLPIPFGNMIPALGIIFFSLGLMEEDGLWVIAGFLTMVSGAVIFSTLLWALFKAGVFVFLGAFGYAP
jgi:hypothetical protein